MPREKSKKEEEMEAYARKRAKQMKNRSFINEPISDPYMEALTKSNKRWNNVFAKARHL